MKLVKERKFVSESDLRKYDILTSYNFVDEFNKIW